MNRVVVSEIVDIEDLRDVALSGTYGRKRQVPREEGRRRETRGGRNGVKEEDEGTERGVKGRRGVW
eukprot:755710-Hanusia_phi.AAC.1